MGISNPRLSVPRDPPVWCEAETGSAANITPELPAEREKALSKHGRRRAVINPRPRMVGRSGRPGAATRVVPQRFVFRLCLLWETKAIFYWRKTAPGKDGGTDCEASVGIGPYGCVAGSAGKESPSHGFAVPVPFRQGGRGDGGMRIATASLRTGLAMTHYKECGEAGRCRHRPLRTVYR